MKWWCRTWPLNGSSRIRAKQKLLRKYKGACKSSWSPRGNHKSVTLTIRKACEDLSWNHCTSTPHRSQTNGFAERAVRRVKEGTSAVLLQSGLDEKWWADSMECYTSLRNVTDLLSDGKTPYERRFGQTFERPIIPFGSLVEYHPITAKDQSRIHQFGKKVLPGLFLGYALYVGRIWKGDTLVADIESCKGSHFSDTKWKIHILLVEPVLCSCTVGHITARYSRHDSDILLCTQTSWAQVASHRK